jgi:hypothetical protein
MATSGTIGSTVFNVNKVVDTAFRRCRLKAEQVTPEMQSYAVDALYLLLSDLGNVGTPSWCIEDIILPFYVGQPTVTLPVGTVGILNANYRKQNNVSGATSTTATSYTVNFGSATIVNTVGVFWSANSVDLTFEVSTDNSTWVAVGGQTTVAVANETTWTDIAPANAYQYFRITSLLPFNYEQILLQNTPSEVPLAALNRDDYVNQSNKLALGQPVQYWFQRDIGRPLLHLYQTPNLAAEQTQLIVWRHRHIMDVGTLRDDIEIPQRWYEAIVSDLANKLAATTAEVDVNLMPILEQRAALALNRAWAGDSDGSSTFIQPWITPYTV